MVALAGAFSREFSTIHLAGHDHILQVVPLEEGSLHAICGGGGGTDEPYSVNRDQADQLAAFTGGGWCLLRFWSAVAALELYDAEGNLRHRSVLARP